MLKRGEHYRGFAAEDEALSVPHMISIILVLSPFSHCPRSGPELVSAGLTRAALGNPLPQ